MFTVGVAMLGCSRQGAVSGVVWKDEAFFFALQHSYGCLQSTYRENRAKHVMRIIAIYDSDIGKIYDIVLLNQIKRLKSKLTEQYIQHLRESEKVL